MKISTKKTFFALLVSLVVFSTSNAQQKVSVSVAAEGGDYTSILAAIQGVSSASATPMLVDGDSVVVNIAAGTFLEPYMVVTNLANAKMLKIRVQGAGALSTFLSPGSTPNRIWQFNDITTANESSRVQLSFNDVTFTNCGGTANATGSNGAIFNFNSAIAVPKLNPLLSFKNVIFRNNSGRSLFVTNQKTWNLSFDNCLFKDNALTPSTNPTAMNGIISYNGPSTTDPNVCEISISNTTFMSNTFAPGGTSAGQGAILGVANTTRPSVVLNNVVIVNNLFTNGATAAITPLLSFNGQAGSVLTMNKVVMIGNVRTTDNMDRDISLVAPANYTVSGSENVVMTFVESGASITDKTGFKINADYTYTDPRIAFTMDGALPLLTNDMYGIGHTAYSGSDITTGTFFPTDLNGRIFANNSTIIVDGYSANSPISVYNTVGSLIYTNKVSSNRLEISVAAGFYIVKVDNITKKIIVD